MRSLIVSGLAGSSLLLVVGAAGAPQVDCPEGTRLVVRELQEWTDMWCEKGGALGPVKHGPFISLFRDGQKRLEMFYENGQRVGGGGSWYRNGQLSARAPFVRGKQHGEVRTWHPNGQLFMTGHAIDGKREGLWVWYFPDGTKRQEEEFVGGVSNGALRTWYPNGQLEQEGQYRDGVSEGLWTTWYENGRKKAEGTVEKSHRVGFWTFWEPDGAVRATGEYEQRAFYELTPTPSDPDGRSSRHGPVEDPARGASVRQLTPIEAPPLLEGPRGVDAVHESSSMREEGETSS